MISLSDSQGAVSKLPTPSWQKRQLAAAAAINRGALTVQATATRFVLKQQRPNKDGAPGICEVEMLIILIHICGKCYPTT